MATVVALTSVRHLAETGFYRASSAGAPRDALRLNDTRCLHELHSSETGLTSMSKYKLDQMFVEDTSRLNEWVNKQMGVIRWSCVFSYMT